jgi:hypothetical protein
LEGKAWITAHVIASHNADFIQIRMTSKKISAECGGAGSTPT